MSTRNRYAAMILVAGATLLALGTTAEAATTVNVRLWDKTDHMDMGKDMGYEMGHALGHGTVPNPMAPMGIKLSTSHVPAGQVTFNVSNISGTLIHEMIVMPITDKSKSMPYDGKLQTVDEDEVGDLGEVSELDPSGHGSLTLDLKAGKYLLYCNVPGHFASGMWTTLTVK